MEKIFWFCAIVGGVIVVVQFLMSILGVGIDDGDGAGALDSDGASTLDMMEAGDGTSVEPHADPNGWSFLRAFSVSSVTAGMAFFGLAGLACRSYGLSVHVQLGVSGFCGFIALYSVYYMMRSLSSFNKNGAVRVGAALNAEGSVYLTIPKKREGKGKISIVVQERTMEYEAVSDSEEPLKSGTPIVVVDILSPSLMLVRERNARVLER